MIPHKLDPKPAHAAAALFGRLEAQGLLKPGEAQSALAAAVESSTGVDPLGLATRLNHTLADTRAATARDILREERFAAARPPAAPPPPPLTAVAASLPDPETIPPRAWLYGSRLIHKFVTVLAAPGGVGKSALAIGQAICIATGRPVLGERVHHSCPVWLMNLEDPLAEIDRRIAAFLAHHAIPRDALTGRLYLHSGRDRRVTMVDIAPDGTTAFPDRDRLIAAAQAAGVGLIVVDPFVKSHRLDENSNPHMDSAATAWGEVAEATGAAILLVHHTRKGATSDLESTRGAKALTDAARAAAIMAPMTPEEANALGVPARDRRFLVRLDDAKANLAPLPDAARWFRLESVRLNNGNDLYPEGDRVGAIAMWKPISPLAALDPAACNAALDLIAKGPGDGSLYTAHRTGRAAGRWAGRVLMDRYGLEEAPAAAIVNAWLRSGLLTESSYRDPLQRKSRIGVRVDNTKRPTLSKPTPTPGDAA